MVVCELCFCTDFKNVLRLEKIAFLVLVICKSKITVCACRPCRKGIVAGSATMMLARIINGYDFLVIALLISRLICRKFGQFRRKKQRKKSWREQWFFIFFFLCCQFCMFFHDFLLCFSITTKKRLISNSVVKCVVVRRRTKNEKLRRYAFDL